MWNTVFVDSTDNGEIIAKFCSQNDESKRVKNF